MSTINVDIVNPQSGNTVTVNGIVAKKEPNKPLILWAGVSQTSIGNACTIVGEEAMIANTGNSNTAIGALALRSNTTAVNNTAVGNNSSVHNTTGVNNTSIGYGSLIGQSGLTTGSGNTAIGTTALSAVTTSNSNTGLGIAAGFSITTGGTNTCLGAQSANLLTTGSNNIAIGHDSQAATPTTSNSITLGNGSNTVLRCAVTSITSLSDVRDKKNIEESTYGLDFVDSLKPVTFEWNTRDGAKKDVKDLGFIAQDLKEVDDEYLGLVYSENPEKLEASYGRLIPVLVKAIQELSKEVKQLKNK